MGPEKQLPYSAAHANAENYVEALLNFVTTSDMLQTLCGGVHILDFLTREPDLYETVLLPEWRDWLRMHEISDVLDLLMREDIETLLRWCSGNTDHLTALESQECLSCSCKSWRGGVMPPTSLLHYINDIRNLTLDRSFRRTGLISGSENVSALSRQIAVGMKPKKTHEVVHFAAFVNNIVSDLASTETHNISYLVDFGSGQNYLGRVLASPLYAKRVIAVESKKSNINGAKEMDVIAKLAKKKIVLRNKKAYRQLGNDTARTDEMEDKCIKDVSAVPDERLDRPGHSENINHMALPTSTAANSEGNILYVEKVISDGNLAAVISLLNTEYNNKSGHSSEMTDTSRADLGLMVISLHSCGNLLHHGLRSLVLNDSVKAVAMVGCCYNLVTERLGPPTYKLPTLRPPHPRLDQTTAACDPDGFPMSERMMSHKHRYGQGIRLNITARMMAVQAPQNWTATECDSFFTRHFYRALLQRIFLDRGVVEQAVGLDDVVGGRSPRGWRGGGQPMVIGSLRKTCYASFPAYVRGAVIKLEENSERGIFIKERMESLSDGDLLKYEEQYRGKRHELSLIWSLMAFSAGVIESAIVVDRWLFLREQKEISKCWVETVFAYEHSPRNLVVVGIKK